MIKWTKPKKITGGRVSITSEWGDYCINKEGGVYKGKTLKGMCWKAIITSKNLEEVKNFINNDNRKKL